jgi:hypothetical protein
MNTRSSYRQRFLYAIALGPSGDYVVAPIYAFNPESWSENGNETYPLLKRHGVIATGTKTECLRGEFQIRKERLLTKKNVPLDRALEILKPLSDNGDGDGAKPRDWSKCHQCFGNGSVYAGRMKIRCSLCGGSGRGAR